MGRHIAKSATTDVRVYRFGLRPPLDWHDECDAEMRGMNALWNKLVEIDNAHREEYRALAGSDPVIAAIDVEIAAARERLMAISIETKRRRVAARSKRIDTSDFSAERDDLRAAIKGLSERRKEAAELARVANKTALGALEERRKSAVKTARQSSGLYWGNYNAILSSYETARQRTIANGGELRFRRFDGTGRLTAQLQGGLTVEEIFGCMDAQLRIVKPPEEAWRPAGQPDRPPKGQRKRARQTTVEMVVYSRNRTPRRVTWPMVMHRPLPDGAVVKSAEIVRRRVADRDEWSLCLTVREPASDPRPGNAACGIDLGWRRRTRQDGRVEIGDGVRVAVVASEADGISEVVLPERIVEAARHCDTLQARIDQRVNNAIAAVRSLDWSDAPGDDEHFVTAAHAARTSRRPSGRTTARLAREWRRACPEWQPEALAALELAVRLDRRDWRERNGLGQNVQRSRREFYRREAKRICETHRMMTVEKINFAELSRRETRSGEDNPTPEPARWYRRLASPGELALILRTAAAKVGTRVIEHSGPSTRICHCCGSSVESTSPEALIWTCAHCGASWDQDHNAARNLLASGLASVAAEQEKPGPLADAETTEKQTVTESRWARVRRLRDEKEAKRRALENSYGPQSDTRI